MSITAIAGASSLVQGLFSSTTRKNLPTQVFATTIPKTVPAAPAVANTGTASTPLAVNSQDAPQRFPNYMKKSIEEQMKEAWLARHGISKEKFDAMSESERQKLIAQMKHDFIQEAQQQIDSKRTKETLGKYSNILV